jgi:hypothetical protein
MKKYKSIETIATELDIPKLYIVSSRGFTTKDIAAMKYKDLEPFGLTPEEFGNVKKYLKSKKSKINKSDQMNQIENTAPEYAHASGSRTQDPISNEMPAPPYEEHETDHRTRVTNYPVQNQMSQPRQIAQPKPIAQPNRTIIGTQEIDDPTCWLLNCTVLLCRLCFCFLSD